MLEKENYLELLKAGTSVECLDKLLAVELDEKLVEMTGKQTGTETVVHWDSNLAEHLESVTVEK